ncbi:hypothetical protein [Streptomyces olivaceus]|uniref:hypothetical protein n=1 Tax=Streptomyces olivaceus TaxID=47716 RepID=UPI0036B689C1
MMVTGAPVRRAVVDEVAEAADGRQAHGNADQQNEQSEHLEPEPRWGRRLWPKGIAVAVWVNTLPRLQQGEPWYEIGIDDPDRRRRRYAEPVSR